MSVREFALPDLGEGLTEGEILAWRVDVGDRIRLNAPLVEVETAKAAVEIPSPFTGRVCEILAEPGAVVDVGQLIVRIDDEAEGRDSTRDREPLLVGYGVAGEHRGARRRRPDGRRRAPVASSDDPAALPQARNPHPRTKPPLRKLARDRNIDLSRIDGSGPGGIITRDDILALCEPATPAPSQNTDAGIRTDTRTPVRGIRGATARAMTASAAVPQVTVFHTVDVTAAVDLLAQLRALPEFAAVTLSPLLLVARALLGTCRAYPGINACWEDGGDAAVHVVRGEVHLGIAADTERGLIVPNIKNADRLSLVDLAAALQELTRAARAGTYTPKDVTGGTITITNIGAFGVDVGAPLLNPGEGAILCAGTVCDRPWAHHGELAVRKVVPLALTVDHRIIDGALAARALADVGARLAAPLRLVLDRS